VINAEKLVKDYLEVELATRVGGSAPKDTGQAWIKVTQLDERNVAGERTDHFNAYYLQLDCYASVDGPAGQVEALALYQSARNALRVMPDETFTDAVVSAVTFGSCPRMPDETFDPPRQRYILNINLYGRAA